MYKKPVLERSFYKDKAPKGYHTVKVRESEKQPGKYSFACTYGNGVMSSCDYEKDTEYTFGHFDTPEEALEAGKQTVLG